MFADPKTEQHHLLEAMHISGEPSHVNELLVLNLEGEVVVGGGVWSVRGRRDHAEFCVIERCQANSTYRLHKFEMVSWTEVRELITVAYF